MPRKKEIERLKGALEFGIDLAKKVGRSKAQYTGIYKTNTGIRNKLNKLGYVYRHNVKTDEGAMKKRKEKLRIHLQKLYQLRKRRKCPLGKNNEGRQHD